MKREYRGRQILSVYLSPIVAVAGVLLAYIFFDEIDFLNQISEDQNSLFFRTKILVWNFIIILVFSVIKLFLCPIMKKIWRERSWMEKTSTTWYEFDEDNDVWFLRLRYRNLRTIFHVFSWVIAAECVLIFFLGMAFGEDSALWLEIFPAAALVVVTEIYNFLSGYTKPEYLHTVDGDNIGATRMDAYYKLRKIYEALFPSAMLVSHTGNEYGEKEGATELLNSYRESDDPIEQIVGDYYSHLKKKNGLFDVDLVSMTNVLLHKKSVVVFNPFYRDLGEYLLLPLVDTLVNDKKCLVIVGRNALCTDVISWLNDVLKDYSRTRNLWRAQELSTDEPNCEVGVLAFSQIYDSDIINKNAEFFQETGFVLLIEPSKMIATSQAGLGIIVEKMDYDNRPTFCVCDHDADGLVDTLSHILQTNITEVIASPIPRSVYTAMGWAANGDFIRQKLFGKQTHYLGNGVELAAVALKNQIPLVSWYSAEKAPVKDIRWIAGQYYPQICRYTNMQSQQKSIDERITFSSNLWGGEMRKGAFVIAEDEFCNLFATIRAYLTRGENQSFVNVLSENYLLRDYMRYNRQLFMNDPKAIPAISAHYAKTERNTVLRLILMMACAPIDESYIQHELSILGYEVDNPYQTLSELIYRYTFVSDTIVTVQNAQRLDENLVQVPICRYSISRQVFDANFADTLKNAYFVVEDEKLGREYIDARLFEHITQSVMPGQFLTHNGKLYRVHAVSPSIGCVLHRAADSYTGRHYYKQLRTYHLGEDADLIRSRKVMDIEIALERRAFSVTTTGYLDMRDNNDLRSAKVVDLAADPSLATFERSYKNKTVLRLNLPDTDDRICFTISMLLGELFRSTFPDAWPYLAALSVRPEDVEGMLDMFVYRVDGAVDESVIYIVEDSDMDLGLLEAIDNNLMRFFEILCDYLDWHFEKMREAPARDPIPPPIEPLQDEEIKRKNFLSRIARRIKQIFSATDEKEHSDKTEDRSDETPASEALPEVEHESEEQSPFEELNPEEEADKEQLLEHLPDEEPSLEEEFEITMSEPEKSAERTNKEAQAPLKADDAEDFLAPIEEQIILREEDGSLLLADGALDVLDLQMPITPSRYQKECFLKFGFDEIDDRLSLEDVRNYLRVRGWSNNDLTKARKRTEVDDASAALRAENFCDFCQAPLSGVSYEKLADGRTRCNDCATTAINEVSKFKILFRNVEMMMENIYNITIPAAIAVRMADARTIAKQTGRVFKPSTKVAVRVLGFAQQKRGRYTLFVENGSPRLATIDTTTHELTHIWQYLNWNDEMIQRIYEQRKPEHSKMARDIIYEGMAMWTAIQLLYAMGETRYAKQQERQADEREDIYGLGFRLYRQRYGMARDGDEPAFAPFAYFPPLDPADVRKAIEGGD